MEITAAAFAKYSARLKTINSRAASDMLRFVDKYGLADRDALIDYAYGLATKYGEASAAVSAEMYDAIAELSGQTLPAAVVAPTANYNDVKWQIERALEKSLDPEVISSAVGRIVKQTGEDTTLRNAGRDGAEYAWIPQGDTCAYCIMLASYGWQKASKKMENSQARHIHANCDCEYCVRFDEKTTVGGYRPGLYASWFDSANGRTTNEKVNSLRREFYAENSEEINAQKRDAYAKRKERESSMAEEIEI